MNPLAKAVVGTLFLFISIDVEAQKKAAPVPVPVDGFWIVTKVTVGGKEMTPVARWFKLAVGKQTSGNGWVQHSYGTYKYDKKNSEVSFITANEPADEFGPFKVVRKGPLMTWSRKEEGEDVVVELKTITDLPMGPWDQAKGVWVLESAVERDLNITKQFDPDHKHFLFIRWDRQYVKQINAHERISGYWFFEAHRPEITFISEDREQLDEKWNVAIEGQKLILKGSSENVKDMVLTYQRANDFPK